MVVCLSLIKEDEKECFIIYVEEKLEYFLVNGKILKFMNRLSLRKNRIKERVEGIDICIVKRNYV